MVGFNGSFSTPRMKSRSAHKRHRVRRPVKAERQYLGKTELIETRDKRFKKGSGFRRAIARVFPSRAKLQAEAIRMWTASKNAMLNEYDDLNGLFNRFVRKRLMLDLSTTVQRPLTKALAKAQARIVAWMERINGRAPYFVGQQGTGSIESTYNRHTVPQLRAYLKEKGLASTGCKADLIQRILSSDQIEKGELEEEEEEEEELEELA